MRSLVTGVATLAFVIFASTFASTKPSCASTVINVCGKFSFWVPDDWKATKDSDNVARTTFDSPSGNLSVVAGPLAEDDAELGEDDVTDFADDELDEMKVTSDKRDMVEKYNVRLVEGTGKDEDDAVVFKMLALDPGADNTVLAVLVYGSEKDMNKSENQATIDQILRSLRPHE